MNPVFDLIVIGGGSGGVRTARWAAGLGASVAIIEKDQFGGTCVVRGCIPKKLMSLGAHFHREADAMKNYGWTTQGLEFSWETMKKNRDEEIQRLTGIYKNLLVNSGVKVFNGKAKINSPTEVEVNGEKLRTKNILIATGARPHIPDIPGKEHLLTSDDFFEQKTQAKSVALIGAGYIGVELASIYLGLGSETHLVAKSHLALNRFDHEVSQFLTQQMQAHGMKIHLKSEVVAINKKSNHLDVELTDGKCISVEAAIISVGRRPNTEGLGLETLGIRTHSDGRIQVDKNMQTTVAGIYAVGDVSNKLNLTPVATAEGMWLAEYLFGKKPSQPFSYDCIPTAVFSDPQIGTVGLSEEQCKMQKRKYKVFKSSSRPLKHTVSKLELRTFMKLLVDQETDKILGCHMAGEDAAEIIQGFAVAVKMGATKKDYDQTIGIHPSSAEEFVTLRTESKPL